MDPQATEEGGHLLRPLRLLRQKSSSQPMKTRGKQMGAPNDSNKGIGRISAQAERPLAGRVLAPHGA